MVKFDALLWKSNFDKKIWLTKKITISFKYYCIFVIVNNCHNDMQTKSILNIFNGKKLSEKEICWKR